MENETKIKKSEVVQNVFLLEFENKFDLTSTFLRFQEHYESPEFRGKIFTLEEFEKWYTKEKGSFTYHTDWAGFNIPSYVLKPFREGKFNPLTEKEKVLLNMFKNNAEPFYIIGVSKGANGSKLLLEHEIAHGLFYTNSEYKKKALEILNKYNLNDLKNWLRSQGGYHEEVLIDECHAYGLTGSSKLTVEIPEGMKKEFRALFDKYNR